MERARTEWLRELGYDLDVMAREANLIFVARTVNIKYHKPARLNDLLDVSAELARMGRASLDIVHKVTRDNELLCDATVTLVTVKADNFKPKSMSSTMKEELSSWMSQ